MTTGQLKDRIMALLRTPVRHAVSMNEKLSHEHTNGYNRAIADVMMLLVIMISEANESKKNNGTGTTPK